MKTDLNIITVQLVEATELIPAAWVAWFWGCISENAPFSWGDNNRSLVTACDFKQHCEARLLDAVDLYGACQEEIDAFLERLAELGDTYIDLEN